MANGSLRLARSRGSGIPLSLVVCGVLALVLVLLGRVQPTLFDRARAFASDHAAPVLEAVRAPLRDSGRWLSSLTDMLDLYQENLRLKEQNARLRQWQGAALALEQRLKRYERLLHAVPDPALGSVAAHVIGRASRPFLNTMILDAGRKQLVRPGEAVVDDRGMIGRIFLTGDHTSWVILLTDLSSRIPVSIQPGNVQAMLAGDNSPSPTLEVSALGARLREGQQVVTSGDGAILPAGLAIGRLHWDGQQMRAALFSDAGRADDVRVLDLKVKAEQLPTPTTADLPVTAAKLAPLAPPPPKVTQTVPASSAPAKTEPPVSAPAGEGKRIKPVQPASPATPSGQPTPDDQ